MQINSQGELISIIAKKSRFLKGDVKLILDALVETMEEVVREESNDFPEGKHTKLLIKSRSLGSLYSQFIPARLGKDKQQLPPTTRIIFRLSQNVRYAGRGVSQEIESDEDLTEYE